jgi:hypothetical protein
MSSIRSICKCRCPPLPQTPGRILFSPVEGLVGLLPVLGVALQTPVDDVDVVQTPGRIPFSPVEGLV